MRDLGTLDLRLLVLFDSLARLGSVSATARALDIPQPAVSQVIAKLEAELGEAGGDVFGGAFVGCGASVAALHGVGGEIFGGVPPGACVGVVDGGVAGVWRLGGRDAEQEEDGHERAGHAAMLSKKCPAGRAP